MGETEIGLEQATADERSAATERLVDMAFGEIARVFRAVWDQDLRAGSITASISPSAGPIVAIEHRDGISAARLARLMDLCGQNLDLEVSGSGAIIIYCPSWPTTELF